MKKRLSILAISMFSLTSAFAFNSVSEILPSGKILICKTPGQVRNGDVVEIHKRSDPKSSSDYSTEKTSEFKLPGVGQKIKLTHKDFHSKGKKTEYHTEEIGVAVISGDSLEGEERIYHTLDRTRHSRRIEKKVKLSKNEALEIQKNCLVAIPENGLKLYEKAAVSWE